MVALDIYQNEYLSTRSVAANRVWCASGGSESCLLLLLIEKSKGHKYVKGGQWREGLFYEQTTDSTINRNGEEIPSSCSTWWYPGAFGAGSSMPCCWANSRSFFSRDLRAAFDVQ